MLTSEEVVKLTNLVNAFDSGEAVQGAIDKDFAGIDINSLEFSRISQIYESLENKGYLYRQKTNGPIDLTSLGRCFLKDKEVLEKDHQKQIRSERRFSVVSSITAAATGSLISIIVSLVLNLIS